MEVKKFMVGPMGANCYILWDKATKDAAVVDPGYPDDRVVDFIQREGLKVSKILLTHGHFDHIGGLQEIRDLTGAPVYIHRDDAGCLTSAGENISTMVGNPMTFEAADVLMQHGDQIKIGPREALKVVHTPGHTPGGVSFIDETFMITGDTLFQGSIGRTDFPGGDYDQIIDSLGTLLQYDEDMKVLPGHGEDSVIGYEKRANPFVRRG
ncbi:MBL fold metallo-hydrolase [Eubacterium barkeri]|uniref:Glyoxylase, beta-lactamase superfamily II n=1 Tax=Eubacterium barkeri TaxID=1528 RepID=A0A1H3D8K2_EUBBA|nr:MBL fold metallo-hydrolase [Eubacterium barkeri]SDX62715.1 Glyoxylase, beta-lactamase superfamily II [Eubacterium barkeri]